MCGEKFMHYWVLLLPPVCQRDNYFLPRVVHFNLHFGSARAENGTLCIFHGRSSFILINVINFGTIQHNLTRPQIGRNFCNLKKILRTSFKNIFVYQWLKVHLFAKAYTHVKIKRDPLKRRDTLTCQAYSLFFFSFSKELSLSKLMFVLHFFMFLMFYSLIWYSILKKKKKLVTVVFLTLFLLKIIMKTLGVIFLQVSFVAEKSFYKGAIQFVEWIYQKIHLTTVDWV